ncbi:tRNA uridine(34) 5-carboxymethylaminomethyl modification radical SAM/GNAT enzyme Elp3 [candidate division WOR-3 bacterium]|nr:tRNA uridine(34) 5-carboxymethylaminomethyl modification radical SAM/GNAT enzyme Elp3 [candidate division WOR-3 bacterium]
MKYENQYTKKNLSQLSCAVLAISGVESPDEKKIKKILRKYSKEEGGFFSKAQLLGCYREMVQERKIEPNKIIEETLRTKPTRSSSGIVSVAVMTKPNPCPGKCIFCPDEENMPKSYLSSEPGSMRALENGFDPYKQTSSRLKALLNTGHETGKCEIIVLGGSFGSYEDEYRIDFSRAIFEALNDHSDDRSGEEKKSPPVLEKIDALLHEQKLNEDAKNRCVGLSFETRADMIDERELIFLRRLGCTKIQSGVQSLDEEVLKKNKVGMKSKDIERAFFLMRSAGFKIQAHVMLNLPGSDPAKDLMTYRKLFSPPFIPDEVKIYPLMVVKGSPLNEMLKKGEFRYYSKETLVRLVASFISQTPLYCRISRVIRDIPSTDTVDNSPSNNLRERVENEIKEKGLKDVNIRNREIRGKTPEGGLFFSDTAYQCEPFVEHFIQCTDSKGRLAGFLRLSVPSEHSREEAEESRNFVPEVKKSGLIRELHVYGNTAVIGEKNNGKSQHRGIGRKLIQTASELSSSCGCSVISVISAVGTRNYYRKLGFRDGDLYQHLSL